MNCPQCGDQMQSVQYEGADIETCESCGGEFVGPEALTHIVRTREMRFDEAVKEITSNQIPQFGVPVQESERHLTCPQCEGSMTVNNYCGDSGVFVDRCDTCGGVWLDHEELQHVQSLLERWADVSPEQIRELAGELERVRQETAEKTNRAFSGSRFSFVNAMINRFLDAA